MENSYRLIPDPDMFMGLKGRQLIKPKQPSRPSNIKEMVSSLLIFGGVEEKSFQYRLGMQLADHIMKLEERIEKLESNK